MDISKTYIKMCEKAGEIEPYLEDNDGVGGTWIGNSILYHLAPTNQPHDKDGYYHITDEMAIRKCETCGNEEQYIKSTRAIWLPRQDQLQEMILPIVDSNREIYMLLCDFITWVDVFVREAGEEREYQSYEQLWLAFVMKKKYNKVWNGEEWLE